MTRKPRMGRIEYINVLPVYHAMETGRVPHGYELVYAPPSRLNNLMNAGELAVASTSSYEYARNPGRYLLLPNLSIASRGEVMSVLFLSRLPAEELDGKTVLVSAQSHTSVALLRMLLRDYANVSPTFVTGNATTAAGCATPPDALLAIGDEALAFRGTPLYPHMWDLGEVWRQWTGLPFVFGVWIADRAFASQPQGAMHPARILRASLEAGMASLDGILDIAEKHCALSREELTRYYTQALRYAFGEEEQAGLRLFYQRLADSGEIPRTPELVFWEDA